MVAVKVSMQYVVRIGTRRPVAVSVRVIVRSRLYPGCAENVTFGRTDRQMLPDPPPGVTFVIRRTGRANGGGVGYATGVGTTSADDVSTSISDQLDP